MTIKTYNRSDLIKTNCLVAVPIKCIGRSKKHQRATKELLEKEGANRKQAAVIISVFNPENQILKEIDQIKGLIKNTHVSLTAPWDDNGYRIITTRAYGAYKEKMDDLIAQFHGAVEVLVRNRDDVVADAQNNLQGLFMPSEYPSAEDIRKAYSAELVTEVIPDRHDIRLDIDEDRMDKIISDAEKLERRKVENVMKHAHETVRQELTEMIDALTRHGVKLADGKRSQSFRDSLIPRMAKLSELLPALNVTNDPAMTKLAQELAGKLCVTDCETLRQNDEVREETKKDAEEILNNLDSYFGAGDD